MTAVPAMSTTLSGATAMPGSFTVAAADLPLIEVSSETAAWILIRRYRGDFPTRPISLYRPDRTPLWSNDPYVMLTQIG